MPPDPSGWPWPLDSVQSWFEDLWNQITSAAYGAVNYIWTEYIWPKIKWLKEQVELSTAWVWDQIKPVLGPIGDWVETASKWAWDSLWNFIEDPLGAIQEGLNGIVSSLSDSLDVVKEQISVGWNWLNEQVGQKIAPISGWITNAWNGFTTWLSEGLANLSNTVSNGLNSIGSSIATGFTDLWSAASIEFSNVSTWIGNSVSGLWDSLTGLASDILSGVTSALGSGFQAFMDWMLKHLGYLAEMLIGAVNFVVAKVKDAVTEFYNVLIQPIIGAMTKGTADPAVTQSMNVLSQALWQNQLSIIDGAYKSAPTSEGIQSAAIATLGALLTAGGVGMITGTAIDMAHMLKDIGGKVTARELIYWLGIPSVTAAIAVLPAQLGLLTPMRYFLMERWQPLQPAEADLIRFAVREVFIPEELERLSKPGPGSDFYVYMARQGYNKFWCDAFWAAHWVRPTVSQLNEALYRGIIDVATWSKEVRLNDYVPYAIPWLQQIIFSPYTRVDLRRMWDMRTIDEATLYKEYRWGGYDDDHAKGMVLWTKVYMALPDLLSRWQNGLITIDTVRSTLISYGMPSDRVEEILETKIKATQPARVSAERDLTKAEIVKGAKMGIIQPDLAVSLLMDLGYDESESWYILAINKVVGAGDPEGYWDMKRVTEAYKKAQGLHYKEVSDELISLEAELKKRKAEIEKLKADKAPDVVIAQKLSELARIEFAYREAMKRFEAQPLR